MPTPGTAGSLGANKALVIDALAPAVMSVSSTTADGTYGVGAVITITVTFSEAVTVTGTPTITLETGATDAVVSYSSGSGTATLTFSYTVVAGHASSDLDYTSTGALSFNGGTIKDGMGNDASLVLPVPGAAGSLATNRNLIINTAPPSNGDATPPSGIPGYDL